MELGLAGKVALVSGGSGAIGGAIALALAAEGAHVAVAWRTGSTRADEIVETITRADGTAYAVHLDHSQPGSAAAALDVAQEHLGAVSVLVANAVAWPSRELGELDGLAASLAVNAAGPAALIDAALPGMRAEGWGRIVVISTDIVAQPMAGPFAYPAAKNALEGVARVLAVREAQHGVLTNVVRPGLTLTDRVKAGPFPGPAVIAAESARTPTGRICTPQDVASVVTFLGSAANSHVNGQVLSVAGGRELTR